jgi:FkbM family methyltransferase
MQRLLFITPHLSTGGLPQFLVKQLEVLQGKYDLYVIMYNDIGGEQYAVQKNRVKKLLKEERYFMLQNDKQEILNMIIKIDPDIIHMEEFPELFMDDTVTKRIYDEKRKYKIVETSHDSGYSQKIDDKTENRRFLPDGFAFISDFHPRIYKSWGIPYEITEYPIEKKGRPNRKVALEKLGLDPSYKHVLNVGLFTSRKNQAEIFEIAKKLKDCKIKFHFVGNQAVNFENYWKPLLDNKPDNCVVWGERSDVDDFYSSMDAFYFASKGSEGDYETNPIVLKEALSWQIPVLLRNLEVYCGMYDSWPVTFLDFEDVEVNTKKLLEVLDLAPHLNFQIHWEGNGENKLHIHCDQEIHLECVVKEIDTKVPLYKTSFDFKDGLWWWLVPFPSFGFPIENYPHFNGFLLEFLDEGKLVGSHEHRISSKEIDIPKFDLPNTGFIFFNLNEFFVQRKFDFLDIKKGGLVVDVGANFGLFSRYCLERGAGEVLAVEPNSEAFLYLQKNIKQEEGRMLCKVIHNHDGEIEFHESENSLVSGLYKDRNDMAAHGNLTTKKIECLTLDSLLKDEEEIDLLKMDVEGAEYEILEACSDETLNKCSKVYLEFHDGINNRGRLEKIKQKFLDLGFKVAGKNIQSTEEEYYQGWFCWAKKTPLPKRAFISVTTENYLPVTEFLVKSINEFSSIPIVLYGINCDINFDYPCLIKKRIDVDELEDPVMTKQAFVTPYEQERLKLDKSEAVSFKDDSLGVVRREDVNTYKNLSLKTKIIAQSIDDGIEEGILVDADGMVKSNVDEIFSYFSEIENYPLVGKGLFQYMMYNGRGNAHVGEDSLEDPLMKLAGVDERTLFYSSTNFLLFNKNTKQFFEDCYELSSHPAILERPDYYAAFQDETIINVMLWKYKAKKQLPLVHFNLIGEEGYKNFLEVKDKGDLDYIPGDNVVTMLETEWQQVPPNKNDVKFFHGCKSPSELQKVFNLMSSPKVALVTLFDKGYSNLAEYSKSNFKNYCDKHNIDFICYDDVIDKTRPPHWSKIDAVLTNIEKYDWIWWLDIDSLIMDSEFDVRNILDKNYDMIFTRNEDYPIKGESYVINGSYISNGSSFYRNSPLAIQFLKDCKELKRPETQEAKEKIDVFDREQRAMRLLLKADERYSSKTKLVHERVCNSYWYTNDYDVLTSYPSWNEKDNIYKDGDFVIQFAGQQKDFRPALMKHFADKAK